MMGQAGVANLVVGSAVLIWILYRQLRTRPLKERSRIAIILVAIGAVQTVAVLNRYPPSVHDILLLVASMIIGIGLAAVRALTIRIWATGDQVLRRGSVLTALLWLLSIAQHLAVERFVANGLGYTTLLIYFGLVLAAQRRVLMIRARSRGFFEAGTPAYR